jgi:hypothetical protein
MKLKVYKLLGIGALVLLSSGCANVIEFRVPTEFKDKKKIEDPPLTQAPLQSVPKEALG